MPTSKFVYVVEVPMSKRDAKRFGIEIVSAAGFEVEIWDVQPLFLPEYPVDQIDLYREIPSRRVSDIKDLEVVALGLTRQDLVMCLSGMSQWGAWSHKKLRQYLLDSDAPLATISSGHVPFNSSPLSQRVAYKWNQEKDLKSLFKSVLRWAKNCVGHPMLGRAVKHRLRRPFDFVFAAASIDGLDPALLSDSTAKVWIHSLDVDLALAAQGDHENPATHVVFLDSMGPLHPDLEALGMSIDTPTQAFFEGVARALRFAAEKHVKPVIVAGHPRGKGIRHTVQALYEPFEVRFGESNLLIANSSLVLAEPSTSLGLAAWFRKPIAILDRPDLPLWYRQWSWNFKNELGCEIWDVTANPETWRMPTVDEAKYARYVEKYMKKPDTPMKPFWEVVVETLKGRGLPVSGHSTE